MVVLRAVGDMYTDSATVTLLSGDEPFRGDGPSSVRLSDYWRWSGSSLVDNTARGVLAEFLVAAALGVHRTLRIEWEPYDLKLQAPTDADVTIEVKSAATVQSWPQKRPSRIQFGIAPRKDSTVTRSDGDAYRQADIYVFCVWRPNDPHSRCLTGADTLDVDEWTFYVLRTTVLDAKVLKGKTIGEKSLLGLEPKKCCYRGLRDAIEAVAAPLLAGIDRGVDLFRKLVRRANRGEAVGISYKGFIEHVHGVPFAEPQGRRWLRLADRVTTAAGGRKQVRRGDVEIAAGMDTFIWPKEPPHLRSPDAWKRSNLPYPREEWFAVFPEGSRQLIDDA